MQLFLQMHKSNISVTSSKKAFSLIKDIISYEKEEVWTLSLNTLKKPLFLNRHFIGTLNECTFHPRDIFQSLIKQNAHSYILFHSHPSGCPKPSKKDIEITSDLFKASKLMRIDLTDHIIIAKNKYYSFKDYETTFKIS